MDTRVMIVLGIASLAVIGLTIRLSTLRRPRRRRLDADRL